MLMAYSRTTLGAALGADIVCTRTGGCFETKLTIISNGSPYRGLAHKPRVNKSGKVVVPRLRRSFE